MDTFCFIGGVYSYYTTDCVVEFFCLGGGVYSYYITDCFAEVFCLGGGVYSYYCADCFAATFCLGGGRIYSYSTTAYFFDAFCILLGVSTGAGFLLVFVGIKKSYYVTNSTNL